MSTYVSLTGGAGPAVAAVMRLKALAADVNTEAKSILTEIQNIEHGSGGQGAPWGDEEAGKQLVAQYNQKGDGDTVGFSESLREQLASAGQFLDELADAILDAVASVDSVDADNAEGLNQ